MKNKFLLPLIGFLILAALLAVGLFSNKREGAQEVLPSPFIGKPVPNFTLPVLTEPGKTFNPEQMRGKVWLVNFWGSWCPACRDEHPVLVEFARKNGVPMVGIDFELNKDKQDSEQASARGWLQQLGDPYAYAVFDAFGKTAIDFGVYGAPETFVIDKNGVIRYKHVGPLTMQIIASKIMPVVKEYAQ
jgi:cytochrome c biogenesis protein CcmG/thiol:disulfide interchange protein DsbE